jgi:2'-5' RNA ligase
MTLPVRFSGRWEDGRSRTSYEDAVCWHLLLGADTGVRAMAEDAQRRLARFPGLHMTPARWLHVTVLRAGTSALVTPSGMDAMLATAQAALGETAPVSVTLRRVLYHPEAVALGVSPRLALAPVLEAARAATREVLGADPGNEEEWVPHLTLCYSTAEQPAAPVIAELGTALPSCGVVIGTLSLVVQEGPEDLWNWRVAGNVRLLGDGIAAAQGPSGVPSLLRPFRVPRTRVVWMPRLPGKAAGHRFVRMRLASLAVNPPVD